MAKRHLAYWRTARLILSPAVTVFRLAGYVGAFLHASYLSGYSLAMRHYDLAKEYHQENSDA